MNIHQAKRIPIAQILEKMGTKLVKQKGAEYWYLSPLRIEKTPSFHVNTNKNIWYDFGIEKGGDNIALICAYLEYSNENNRIQDALRWSKNMLGYNYEIEPVIVPDYSTEDTKLVLRSTMEVEHLGLVKYLQRRCIPLSVATKHLKEVRIYNTERKTTFSALGFRNETGGFELRNPTFKGSLRPKNITFIRGRKPKPDGINIFEGFMDYLSIITHKNGVEFDDDTIVLNSLSCMKKATAYIKNYGYRVGYTWFDNDKAGKQATKSFAEFFKMEDNMLHKSMNTLYENHKDVNEWLVSKMELPD